MQQNMNSYPNHQMNRTVTGPIGGMVGQNQLGSMTSTLNIPTDIDSVFTASRGNS